MVSTKKTCSAEKNKSAKEKSPSPKPFKEPEGMVTVDLNSGEYNNLDTSEIPKCKHNVHFKYWIRILCTLGVMVLGIAMLIYLNVVLLKTEITICKKIPFKNSSQYALTGQGLFKEKLTSGFYLQDLEEKILSCKLKKTLEDCCNIFDSESDLMELKKFCTVDNMLDIILRYEKQRLKRSTFSEPALYGSENNFVGNPRYEDYYDYRENSLRQNYGEEENNYNNIEQFDNNEIEYNNPENFDDLGQNMNSNLMHGHQAPPDYDHGNNNKEYGEYGQNIYPQTQIPNYQKNRQLYYPPSIPPMTHITPESQKESNSNFKNAPQYPFKVKSSVDVTGMQGHNRTLEIDLKNTDINLTKNSYKQLNNAEPKKASISSLNTITPDKLGSKISTSYKNMPQKKLQVDPKTFSKTNTPLMATNIQTETKNKNEDKNYINQTSPSNLLGTNLVKNTSIIDLSKNQSMYEEENVLEMPDRQNNNLVDSAIMSSPNDHKTVAIEKQIIKSTEKNNNNTLNVETKSVKNSTKSNVTPRYSNTEKINKHQLRVNQADADVRSKNKMDSFSGVNEETQINQQAMFNPCFNPYMPYGPPYRVGSPYDATQTMRVVPSTQSQRQQQQPMYVLNPPMYYPYAPSSNFLPSYYQPVAPQQVLSQQQPNPSFHATGPGGQFYLCNPIPTPSSLPGFSGVEVRREAFNLQDLVQLQELSVEEPQNLTKTIGLICAIGEQPCSDNSKCISDHLFCDNEVQCEDASDELFCSCKERVGKLRLCDGYCDCPDCSDEQGCFGCKENELSCDDWSRFRKSTCFAFEQRCDNVRHCKVTGKDEEECSALSDHLGYLPFNKISNSVGFLHRNYKGKWYPTCFGTDTWAGEVCEAEAGPSPIVPRTHMVLNKDNYEGDFINILPNNEISLVNTCVQDRAAFVECPPIICGLRVLINNPYRPQEVDTSIEDMINEMERSQSVKDRLSDNEYSENDDDIVGTSRVVGGKPSQPGAWPWLVALYKNGIFHCGGVLVNELWVVTAAHCVDRYWLFYYEIQAGILRRFSFSPMDQSRRVTVAIPHQKYNKIDLNHDIALLKLSSPLRYNKYVRPICLPSETTAGQDFLRGPSPGTICTTVGWGATVEHGADPDHMREVEVPIIQHCKHSEDSDDNEICAGLSEGGKDACQGDSGGPFMCRNPNNPSQWYLAGVVSHGEGCARPHEPGVYTRVSKYVGWIAENMKDGKFYARLPLDNCPGYVCKSINRCLPKKRRCDKIVDCLLGDDEENCENHFHDIFKHRNKEIFNDSEMKIKPDFVKDLIEDVIPKIIPIHEYEEDFRSSNIKSFTNVSDEIVTVDGTYFKCKSLLQLVPIYKKCNRIVDCEDGTDEANCKCIDYIKNIDPRAICDGITDCFDRSDEMNCVTCNASSEYYCRQSQKCIPKVQRCDHEVNCPNSEDEMDCYALTDGSTLNLDVDLRPRLTARGVITINRFGVWKPFCNANMSNDDASTATTVCNLLGFEEYMAYHKYRPADKELKVTIYGAEVKNGTVEEEEKERMDDAAVCSGLYVSCSNVTLHSTVHETNKSNVSSKDQELYKLPWFVAIYADGQYRCMGSILDSNRIVTSVKCFDGITRIKSHYTVALSGKGKFHLPVQGPYDQTIRIVASEVIGSSDIVVLKTEKEIIFNRYVGATALDARRDTHRIEKCVTAGIEEGKLQLVRLSPLKPCSVGYRCFESRQPGLYTDESSPWSGVIVCDSGSGWYPAAVYYEESGLAGINLSTKKYTSIKFYKNQIEKSLRESIQSDVIHHPKCEGFLCDLGQCIHKNQTCDGIPDCTNGEDEASTFCYEKERACHLTNNCACPLTHLKCNNQKCVPKSAYCDRHYDCSDGEDEPSDCSCRNYLQLTNPQKICDGILNCLDKTDEDPEICSCRPGSFVCGNSAKCVPQEMVCDGDKDCPNGEDENVCFSLISDNNERSNAGEVMTRTSGIWHSGCFHLNYTTSSLEAMCEKLGFPKGSATQLFPPRNLTEITAMHPATDTFDVVWIRRTPGNRLRLRIRTGNDPFVRFVHDENCFKLFMACI